MIYTFIYKCIFRRLRGDKMVEVSIVFNRRLSIRDITLVAKAILKCSLINGTSQGSLVVIVWKPQSSQLVTGNFIISFIYYRIGTVSSFSNNTFYY